MFLSKRAANYTLLSKQQNFSTKIFQFSIDIALRINKKKQNSNKKTFVQKKAANSVLKKFTTWGID